MGLGPGINTCKSFMGIGVGGDASMGE